METKHKSDLQSKEAERQHMKLQAHKQAQDMQVPLVLVGLFCLAILYGCLTPHGLTAP